MSTKTTLALVNFSGQDITEVSVKNPSGFEDPYADLLPLLNGKPIRENEALCGPVELLDGQPATFTLKVTFADGGTLELAPPDQPDQQDANTYKGGETYVNGVLGRDLGAEQNRMRVWQLSGGGTNGMYVRTVSPRGTASWMQRLVARKPDVTLGELVMPGSHDAGVYEITANYGPGGNEWAQTQNRSFQGQLDSGSRYFDIRVGWYNKVLHAYHGDITGAWGGSLNTILDDVASFLRSSKEAVILKFSHNDDASMCTQIVTSVKTKLSGVIYGSDAQTPRRLATIKLKELQGKALCVFGGDGDGFDTLWNPADGIFPYHDVPVSSPPRRPASTSMTCTPTRATSTR